MRCDAASETDATNQPERETSSKSKQSISLTLGAKLSGPPGLFHQTRLCTQALHLRDNFRSRRVSPGNGKFGGQAGQLVDRSISRHSQPVEIKERERESHRREKIESKRCATKQICQPAGHELGSSSAEREKAGCVGQVLR